MKINEYTREVQDNFQSDLEKRGKELLGSGNFADVYSTKNSKMVLKVFYKDPGYVNFMKVVIAHHDNPHFPRIGSFSRLEKGKYAGLYVVKSELLYKLSHREYETKAKAIQEISIDYDEESNKTRLKYTDAARRLRVEEPSFYQALMIIKENHPSSDYDLGEDNIMKRADGTWVINDPYFGIW